MSDEPRPRERPAWSLPIDYIDNYYPTYRDKFDPETDMDKTLPKAPHYSTHNGVECKDVAGEYTYNVGTAIAYLWRSPYKHESPLDDLKKARDHIEFEIARLEVSERS